MIDKMFSLLDKLIDKFFKNPKTNAACKKLVNKETVSYIFFGVLTTVINLIVSYVTLKLFSKFTNEVVATNASIAIAWVLSVLFAFITNKLFVFNSKNMSVKTLFKEGGAFFGGRLFSYLFELVWMNLTVMVFRMNYMIAKVIGQIVIVIMNYFISKIFVFKNKPEVK